MLEVPATAETPTALGKSEKGDNRNANSSRDTSCVYSSTATERNEQGRTIRRKK
jgi:hypothetical protein